MEFFKLFFLLWTFSNQGVYSPHTLEILCFPWLVFTYPFKDQLWQKQHWMDSSGRLITCIYTWKLSHRPAGCPSFSILTGVISLGRVLCSLRRDGGPQESSGSCSPFGRGFLGEGGCLWYLRISKLEGVFSVQCLLRGSL